MAKYSKEFKMKIIKNYLNLNGEGGVKYLAKNMELKESLKYKFG